MRCAVVRSNNAVQHVCEAGTEARYIAVMNEACESCALAQSQTLLNKCVKLALRRDILL